MFTMNSQRSQQRPPFHSFTVTQSRNGDVVECFYARQCPCCSQYSACQHNSLGNSSQGMCSKAKPLPTSHLTYLLSSNMAYRARLRVAQPRMAGLPSGWVCFGRSGTAGKHRRPLPHSFPPCWRAGTVTFA